MFSSSISEMILHHLIHQNFLVVGAAHHWLNESASVEIRFPFYEVDDHRKGFEWRQRKVDVHRFEGRLILEQFESVFDFRSGRKRRRLFRLSNAHK